MRRATFFGFVAASGLTLSAFGQTRVVPQGHAWVHPGIGLAEPARMVPMLTLLVRADHPDWNYECLTTGELAAEYVVTLLQDAA